MEDQPPTPPLLESRLQLVRSKFFLPSSDEQGSSDLSPPAGRQSLQASTPPPPTALAADLTVTPKVPLPPLRPDDDHLSRPAGRPPPAASRTPPMHQPMDDDEAAMDLDLLLTGPKNEQNLDECLGVRVAGVFDCYSTQLEDHQFESLNVNDGEAAVNEFEIKDYIDPSMLGCFLPSGSSGHGRRGPRRRNSSEKSGLFAHNFGSQEPSTSGGRMHRGRKNNDHWTEDEVKQLVKGVSFYGVGKWSCVKRKYYRASIRTKDHLKDKWKNLVKACKKENGRMLLHLEQSLIERIKEIDAEHPYPKHKATVKTRTKKVACTN